MKKYIALSLILALASLAARSQSSSSDSAQKRAEVKLLLSLMQQDSMINKTIDATFGAMVSQMKSRITDPSITTDSSYGRKWEEIMNKMKQYSKDMAFKLLNEDMVAVYEKYFTLKELGDFVDFYKSASGQAMLHKLPDITREMMQAMTARYIPEMQQMLIKNFSEMGGDNGSKK